MVFIKFLIWARGQLSNLNIMHVYLKSLLLLFFNRSLLILPKDINGKILLK